jgi:signal transduction histidine kinase
MSIASREDILHSGSDAARGAQTAQGAQPPRRSRLSLYGPFLPLLLICLIPLAFALAQTSALERDMRIAATENMLWVVTQTQMESLNLTLAAGNPDHDPAAVEHRFDMLLARLNLLLEGPQRRYMERLGHDAALAEARTALLRHDPAGHERDPANMDALHQAGMAMQPLMNRLANEVMTTEWDAAAARLDEYRAVQRNVLIAVGFALLAALAMSWLLLRNQRALYQGEIETMRAARLHALLEKERDTSAWYRDFAAMVSHQMRTPLTLIDSAVHRLARKGEAVTASDVAERHGVVRGAIGRLTRLVDGALLAGQLDHGRIRPSLSERSLPAIAGQVVRETRMQEPERVVTLAGEGPGLSACCDEHLVGHILGNLLSNALKYSPPDTPVELRLFAQGARVACAVTDRGPGIARQDQPHIFDRYYRGESEESGPGTGLGLALARDLAQLQGGDVSMESFPGRGSVFTLWLPRAQDQRGGQNHEAHSRTVSQDGDQASSRKGSSRKGSSRKGSWRKQEEA